MTLTKAFSTNLLIGLLGVGMALSWPALGQQDAKPAPAPPTAPKPRLQELQTEVARLRALWRQELFQDVDRRHWAYAAATALQAQGVLRDYPAGYFRGRRAQTRYEFAVAIERMQKGGPIADTRDKAAIDELAQEFRSALTLLKEDRKLPRERRWLGP